MQRQPMKINWMQNYWPKSELRHHAICHIHAIRLYKFSVFSSREIRLRNTLAKSLSIDSDDSCDEIETEEQLRKFCFCFGMQSVDR